VDGPERELPFGKLRSGDVIVAVDGTRIEPPHVVAAFPEQDRVRLVEPEHITTEWWLYRDNAPTVVIADHAALPAQTPGSAIETAADREYPLLRSDDDVVLALAAAKSKYDHAMSTRGDAPVPRPGELVWVRRWLKWQPGIVVSTGRRRAKVAFATGHTLKHADHNYARVWRTYFPLADVHVANHLGWASHIIDDRSNWADTTAGPDQ
jgi:hypothetical protein